ncbi:MAG: ATP-grasp domain-containing protein [Candidatus Omnitrophota bacterium]
MPKTIGFTYDLKSDFPIKEGDPEDLNAEFDFASVVDRVKLAIESFGHKVVLIGNVKKLLSMLPELGVDIVFNICEGIGSRNREAQVPVILDTFGIPYIGSDGLTMSVALDKIMTKKILMVEGIPTPRYLGINTMDDLLNLDHMGFPMIVKLRNEGTSKGLSDNSVVHNRKELKKQSEYLFDRYNNSPLIIEKLISGSEFTVPIIGNSPIEAFPSVQCSIKDQLNLGEMIYTFERVTSGLEYICPAKISKRLEKKLMDLALRTYRAVDCLDFGRVDFRVDKDSNPYVLEINPLPSLSIEDVFSISPKIVGCDFDKVINKIIEAGLKRYGIV